MNEPMSTPDSGGLRGAVEALLETDALTPNHDGTPEHYTVHADDVEYLVETVRDLLAARPEPVPTPDSADPATVGERSEAQAILDMFPADNRHVFATPDSAARDAAWVERLAAMEGERDHAKASQAETWKYVCEIAQTLGIEPDDGHPMDAVDRMTARAVAAEAERDTARREAGERIAQAWDEAVRQVANVDPAAIHNPYRSL